MTAQIQVAAAKRLPEVGEAVKVTSHYTYASRDNHGEVARVIEVHTYPPGIVDGDVIVEAAIVHGAYTDHTEAHGLVVPFLLGDLS